MNMRIELRKRIFLNFILIIALFGILGALFGAALMTRYTLQEAQTRVSLDLRSAWRNGLLLFSNPPQRLNPGRVDKFYIYTAQSLTLLNHTGGL